MISVCASAGNLCVVLEIHVCLYSGNSCVFWLKIVEGFCAEIDDFSLCFCWKFVCVVLEIHVCLYAGNYVCFWLEIRVCFGWKLLKDCVPKW